ncbi:MAG TPA: hypothetical protein DCP31_12760 [Cyanobacteria bacterium UBA8543]|nr:hypothetical protein [Cyanobacteria bacterium UBA8543]
MDNFNQEDADKLRGIKALKKVKELIEALTKMALDPKAAPGAKALAIACLLYVISPLDAIPDALPVVGWSDDIALIVATVSQLAVELKPYIPENNTPKNITVKITKDEETSNTTLIEQLKRFQIIMTATFILFAIVVIFSLVLMRS